MTADPAVRRTRGDAFVALVLYAIVLLGIPSALIVKPLGAAGTPAQIIAIGLFGWWVLSRVIPHPDPPRPNPIKWLMLIFAVAILASYVAGMSRPIANVTEVNSADRALLSLCAWCGVVLVMADGIGSRDRLLSLLRIVSGGVTAIAVLGIVQFAFHLDLTHVLRFPGLTPNHEFGEIIGRSKYERVTGTTTHPIEFGVVLSATLPLIIHFARFSPTAAQRRLWWVATGLVAVALPMSVARSGALGAAIAISFLFYTWPAKLRLRALAIGGTGAVAMSFVVPGLLGTIRGLFLNASSDPSTQGRTADYAPIIRYVSQNPLWGRGIGTFIPSIYRTLDNAYLGVVAEAGIVGLLALIAVFVGTGFTASSIRRHSDDESVRNLGQSLKAGIVALAVNAATFDALGFAMCAGIIFFFVGATGCLWAIESRRRPVAATPNKPMPIGWIRAAAIVLIATIALGGLGVHHARPTYTAYGTVLVSTPVRSGQQITSGTVDTAFMASVLNDIMGSRIEKNRLHADGVTDYEVALKNGSLVADTDVIGDLDATLYFVASSHDPASADHALAVVLKDADDQLVRIQAAAGVPPSAQFRALVLQQAPAFEVRGRPSRSDAGFLILVMVVSIAFYQVIRRRRALIAPLATRPESIDAEPTPMAGANA